MNLMPELLAWHSTMYNKKIDSHGIQYRLLTKIDYLGMLGQGNRLIIRHLLQLPVKLTPSAGLFHCLSCHCELKRLALL
jgi:hypothetical protein